MSNLEDAMQPDSGASDTIPRLTPIDFDQWDYVPGAKAPWYCSPAQCYGPDELGELKGCVEELLQGTRLADAAARLWEVLQAWEQRLFRRNYHFLNAGWKGWGMFGGSSGTTGASIMQTSNSMKLFSANVYGERHKKIVALLSREVPPVQGVPHDESNPLDQEAAQEAVPYLKAFREQSQMRSKIADAAGFQYTDGRAVFLTYTIASKERFGTETDEENNAIPGRRECVWVGGKLESKLPLMADSQENMGWARPMEREVNRNELRARYPWVRDKIITESGTKDGEEGLARMARANVRLAVQASSSSGEAWQQEATEAVNFFRPSQYETISDPAQRQMFYDTFPTGLEVWTAGGVLAMVREGSMDDHMSVAHCTPGDGQNRESIGTNYLPIQKVLNATISLLDRYFRNGVARRYAMEPYIDVEAINRQSNDPAKVTPVDGKSLISDGLTIDAITGIEKVPEPNAALMQWVQYLMEQVPNMMDGGTPAVFGEGGSMAPGTYGEAKQDRDQALQVFSLPWGELCRATGEICSQAHRSAGQNRVSDFSMGLPNERVRVTVGKLRGSVDFWPTSTEIPPTMAEQQAEISNMLQNMGSVPLFQSIIADPRNLEVMKRFPSLSGLKVPGVEDVELQMEEDQQLLNGVPQPNPQLGMIEDQIQQLTMQVNMIPPGPQQVAAAQQADQQIAQLQQAAKSLPPQVSSVPVAQDASQNHQIHAAIALAELNSPRARAASPEGQQNLHLHWGEHVAMAQKLTPPLPIPVHATVTLDADKLPPAAQAEVMSRLTLEVPPPSLVAPEQEHEVTEETEGINPQTGVPTKRKVSMVGKPLQ